ncbi:MAG: hypothetical protein C4526_08625, partial [Nitrospiraceae bacterium]
QGLLEIFEKKYRGKKISKKVDSFSPSERHIRNGEIYFYAYCRGAVEGFGYWFADKNTSAFLGTSIEEFEKAVSITASPRAGTDLAVVSAALMFEANKNAPADTDVKKIVSILRGVIEDHPSYVMAFFNLGILYFRVGRPEDALECFTETAKLIEDNACEFDPWCLQNRDYELYKILLRKPLNENLMLLLKKEPGALTGLKDLVQFAALYFISLIHEGRGDLFGSIEALGRAYGLYSGHALVARRIAQLAGILGFRDECLSMYKKASELMPLDMDLRMERCSYLYLYGDDKELLGEVHDLKTLITGIKTLSDKIDDLKILMNSFGRFNEGGNNFDPCKEAMLNSTANVLYSCLKKNPGDIRFVIRIAEIWHDLGRLDKVLELVEDYLDHIKKPDNETLSLLADIYKFLEDSVKARRTYFAGQSAALQAARKEVSV